MAKTRPTKGKKKRDVGRKAVVPDRGELTQLRELLRDAGAPDDLLRTLDGTDDPDEILRALEAEIRQPDGAVVGNLIGGFAPLLEPGVDRLTAELVGVEFLSLVRAAAPDAGDVPAMLADLIGQVEVHGQPEALAMLRALAAVGPDEIRLAATESGDRLVAKGLNDPRWAAGLGVPKVGRCFGYGDGIQASIAVTFSYGRRRHAIALLIDHNLGGGVKDCWLADKPEVLRTEYRRAANLHGLDFRDYEPAEALAILDSALSRPPCPEQPDQVQDVRDNLDLVRRRVELLRERQQTRSTVATVHRLKITLVGAQPEIWRRLEVPSAITLHRLHEIIQTAFGWEGHHMWLFSTPSGEYGTVDPDLGYRSAAAKKLVNAAPDAGDRLQYVYDFGDHWQHEILVEEVSAAEADVAYPHCLAGRNAGPPEDCGGVGGYAELVESLSSPDHPDHDDRLDWLGLDSGDEFDPAGFDLDELNKALSRSAEVLLTA